MLYSGKSVLNSFESYALSNDFSAFGVNAFIIKPKIIARSVLAGIL